MLTVHGDLAIANVYAPAMTSDDPAQAERRATFRSAFLEALECRCRALHASGLRVLLIGDLNIAPSALDSARQLQAGAAANLTLEPSPARRWLQRLLDPTAGPFRFVDTFRALHPHARGAYTCPPPPARSRSPAPAALASCHRARRSQLLPRGGGGGQAQLRLSH